MVNMLCYGKFVYVKNLVKKKKKCIIIMLFNIFIVCFYFYFYKYKGIFLCEYEVYIFLIFNMFKMLLNVICFE